MSNEEINWQDFVQPLYFLDKLEVPGEYLFRWQHSEVTKTGACFTAETNRGTSIKVYLDLVHENVLRFRLNPKGIRNTHNEMLVQQEWLAPPFEYEALEDKVSIRTERMLIEVDSFPWQMRVYDADGGELPLFSQRSDDRAYGPGFEVPPTGFVQGPDGAISMRETVAVQPGESIYGFGEKFTSLDKWGQELISWAVDCGNVSSFRSYKNVPFFMSSAGYGIFINSSFPMIYRIGSQSSISYSFHIMDSQLDYFLIVGPQLKHILKRYTDLTGRAPVPPKWSFGFWMSRAGYENRPQVEQVTTQMRARGFPCDVISLDPWWMGDPPWSTYQWDTARFPDPKNMVADLKQKGIRTCLWMHPYIPAGTPIYKEACENGYLVMKPDQQETAPVLEAFTGDELAAVDFTNDKACAWFQEKLTRLLEMGVATFKTDFGEQAPLDAVYSDGRSGVEMHNLYPLIYHRTVFNATKAFYGKGLIWARAGYAGSQRYPVHWGGDSYSSLDQVACQLKGLLSLGISGVPFCSHDVGGFDYNPHAFDSGELPVDFPMDSEVYIRWLQFGVFSSHVRAHGKPPREPWEYGEEVEQIALKYLQLRYRLIPYIYSQAVLCARSGLPMVRPLVLEFQDDLNVQREDMQYMFGSDFLVAPALTYMHKRNVYLPEGQWFDYWTKETIRGGRWVTVDAPLDKLPLWVRGGAVLPMGPEMDYIDQKPLDPLTLELYGQLSDGQTVIYDEDKPEIVVKHQFFKDDLALSISPAHGEVQVFLYGTNISSAMIGEQILELEPAQNGVMTRFSAVEGASVLFKTG